MRAARTLVIGVLAACGVNQTPQPEPSIALPPCVPDRDGVIVAEELPVPLGIAASYYARTNVAVVQTGTDWDFSDETAADDVIELGPVALGTQWYASAFPGGQFAIDAGDGLAGIYHQDAQALWLDGTASVAESPKTLVRYADPVAVLRFPIAAGDAFASTAEIPAGTIAGLPFVGSDRIEVAVAGEGRLSVPYLRFSPVLRVRTHVVRTPSSGAPVVGRRTTAFLFECFGEVTHLDSRVDEPNPDFTTAAYLRRFALGVEP
jgi:hypothetical protein